MTETALPPDLGRRLRVKRAFDLLSSAAALTVSAPVFVVASVAIKIEDRGPVFFTQTRVGQDEQDFRILKFRSMIVDADRFLDADGNPTRDRVTRVGRVLRKFSIDELPQLWNILRGDMSLVGPRPVPRSLMERMTTYQRQRFVTPPGLTGLAQVVGRHSLTWSERIALDLEYVTTVSVVNDLKIVLRTPRALLGSNARIDRKASNDDL